MKKILLLAIAIIGMATIALAATKPEQKQFAHFSIDDVFEPLIDITENADTYSSIFENEFFAFLKDLHDKYDITVTCNLFYKGRGEKSLDDVTDRFKKEFRANSDWLKFSWHGRNGYERYTDPKLNNEAVESYIATNDAICRFAGKKSLTTFIRPSFFSGNKELWKMMRATEYGFDGMYGSDDGRAADAGLDEDERAEIATNYIYTSADGIQYVKSIVRFDNKNAEQGREIINAVINRENPVAIHGIFMHQQSIIPYNADACAACEEAIKILHGKGIPFAFPKGK